MYMHRFIRPLLLVLLHCVLTQASYLHHLTSLVHLSKSSFFEFYILSYLAINTLFQARSIVSPSILKSFSYLCEIHASWLLISLMHTLRLLFWAVLTRMPEILPLTVQFDDSAASSLLLLSPMQVKHSGNATKQVGIDEISAHSFRWRLAGFSSVKILQQNGTSKIKI